MSLDVSLTLDGEEVFSANVTHNLTSMADEAGVYEACWRPEEIGVATAAQLAPPLREGILKMIDDPGRFEAFDPANGWGSYENFLPWLIAYHRACKRYPEAVVRASR
jgi:hypothetical protein